MPVPPRFETVEDAGEFLLNHDTITAVMTPLQYSRFIEFVFEWSDGDMSLPLLTLEFHIPSDLVVNRWTCDGESGSHRDILC